MLGRFRSPILIEIAPIYEDWRNGFTIDVVFQSIFNPYYRDDLDDDFPWL